MEANGCNPNAQSYPPVFDAKTLTPPDVGEAARCRYLEGPPIYRNIEVLKAANSMSILVFSPSLNTE